jgi:uncharacterized protein with NRDE domain
MCLIVFDWQPDSERILTFASNRDEFYERPTQAAHYWDDHSDIYGGRDLKMGGTWLAVSARNRLAAVTNFRAPESANDLLSRGEIPLRFLKGETSAEDFAKTLEQSHLRYAGFNALLFDGKSLVYTSNRSAQAYQSLRPGRYGLSNHLLNTAWPKVERAKQALGMIPGSPKQSSQFLLTTLQDQHKPDDHLLPDTGFGLELERMLSPVFIVSPNYGTRASSVVIIERSGTLHFTERSHQSSEGQTDRYESIETKHYQNPNPK